jgi:hypothetical protein
MSDRALKWLVLAIAVALWLLAQRLTGLSAYGGTYLQSVAVWATLFFLVDIVRSIVRAVHDRARGVLNLKPYLPENLGPEGQRELLLDHVKRLRVLVEGMQDRYGGVAEAAEVATGLRKPRT